MTNELSTEFKYDLVDQSTADFLKQKEFNMREIVGKAYTELGRELKEAQDVLAKNGYGYFQAWVESIGLNKMQANRLIQRYSLVTNCYDQKLLEDLPVSLTYEIAKPSSESTESKKQAKEAVLKGEVKTLKEYKELEAKLRKAEEDKCLLKTKLKQEKEKQPEVVHKKIQIDNTDYESIEKLKKQVKQLERDLNFKSGINENYNKQIALLEEQLSRSEAKVKEYNDFKSKIKNVTTPENDFGRKFESVSSIGDLMRDVDFVLSNKLAPVKYSSAITECRTNETAVTNLRKTIERVEEWCYEMKSYLPKGNRKIIDAEIIK
ncbi:hypothetical protein P8819_15070 [Bacillus velezensis]|uniref:hypothetical protein n=1 Tax=Bacillus velezensis TaxID=492670 RepID=UPI002DC0637D|nr:hypothetical protein [Bacillus velezensis]MEC0405749.1 hypothetical protein [Bacillus velezensis]